MPIDRIDEAVTALAATLPGIPLAEHPERLAAVQKLLQPVLDGARTAR